MLFVFAPQADVIDEGFHEFWTHYPRHEAKKDAQKAWRKLNPSPQLRAQILEAIAQQKAWRVSREWRPEWAYPASWIRGERWEDRVEVPAPRAWCEHTPECVTQTEHTRKLIDAARATADPV